jgi:hypothetical protein
VEDEFEVEVIDLRTGQRVEHPVLPPLQPPEPQDADMPDETEEIQRVPPGWGRGVWMQTRARGALAALAAAVLVGALVLASVPNSQATLRKLLGIMPPTATATLEPGEDTFVAVQTVPWGKLLSDGEAIQPVQGPGGELTLSFTLPRGTHDLEYNAAPFPQLKCQVSVPARPHDTCPLNDGSFPGPQFISPAERTLLLGATFDRLPQDQQLILLKMAGGALYSQSASAQGQAGDHYLTGDSGVQVASAPFRAALVYMLNTDGNRITSFLPPSCVSLCDLGGYSPDQGAWLIQAHVIIDWRYTFADGQTLMGPGLATGPADMLMQLNVAWNGSWQVTVADQGPQLCNLGYLGLQTLNNGPNPGGITARVGGNSNTADGCFLGVQQDTSATPSATAAELLYRFGLILALNRQAQQMFPGLPAANAHEQALAQQMAQQVGP